MRGGSLFYLVSAVGGAMASCALSTVQAAGDIEEKSFDFDIREEFLGAALDEIILQTDVIVLYPHALAEKTGVNPVIGRYTAREAIEALFRGTDFSGGLTESGVMFVSLSGAETASSREGTMNNTAIKKSLMAGASALIAGAAGAHAQDAGPDDDDDVRDTIVVTAQQRAQNLQDVPFSVSAIGGDRLERLGGEGFETFAQRIPGLQLSTYATGTTQLAMRGVSTGLDSADRPQQGVTVGLYLDDTQLSMSANNPDLQLFDLERVEVLRGPQGTLFGAGATSGVIRLISRKPRFDVFEGSLSTEVSTTKGGDVNYTFRGVGNIPLGDKAALRAVGYFDRFDGFMDNAFIGRENTDVIETYGGRAALLVEPTEGFNILTKVIYQKREAQDESWWDLNSPFPDRNMAALEPGDNEIVIADLSVEYDFGAVVMTAVSSYTDRTRRTFGESDGFPTFIGAPLGLLSTELLPTISMQDRFTQELRFASATEGPLEWVAGGFFSTGDRTLTQTLDIPGVEDAGFAPLGETFNVQTDRVFQSLFDFESRQFAFFVDATYYLTEKLSVAAGVRYADYKQDAFIDFRGLVASPNEILEQTTKEDVFNPRFNVSYDVDEDRKVYFQAAQGFRLGGVNEPVPLTTCADDLAAFGITDGPGAFESDSLWNYEAGLKSQFNEGRVTFNVAAFLIDYSDIQTSTRLDCAFNIVDNAGELQSRGVEVEFSAELAEGLSAGFSTTYTDSELTSSESQLGSDGDRAPFVPRWAANAFIDYVTPVNGDWNLVTGFDVQYVGERQDEFDADRADFLPSYATGAARISLENDNLTLDFFVDNLWNERARFSQVTWPFGFNQDVVRVTVNRPRTIGLRATIRR